MIRSPIVFIERKYIKRQHVSRVSEVVAGDYDARRGRRDGNTRQMTVGTCALSQPAPCGASPAALVDRTVCANVVRRTLGKLDAGLAFPETVLVGVVFRLPNDSVTQL